MTSARWIALGALCGLAAALAFMVAGYRRDLNAARARVSAGSTVAQTKCGPIEYAERGSGPAVLLVHGAGGGFDQGLLFAEPLAHRGFRAIAMSRFGYLRTPLPADAGAQAQADAHACLLDALGIDRAAVVGVSAGAPSSMQFCIRHPSRCTALALLVPMAYAGRPAAAPPNVAQVVIDHALGSDFVFWTAARFFRSVMVESILATPMEVVRRATPEEQQRVYGLLDLIQPISWRQQGLRNEGRVAQTLHAFELSTIASPALLVSVEDDRFGTYAAARWTAARIPGAKFVGFAHGGHLMVGHDAEVMSLVADFIGGQKAL